MPRNHYTTFVNKQERARIARKEKDLVALSKTLKFQDVDPVDMPVVNKDKVRRSARVEQKRRHKAKRRRNTDGIQS